MTRLEMVRLAVGELGNEATAEQIDRFIAEKFGQQLGVRFIPIYRATLRGECLPMSVPSSKIDPLSGLI